jgi:biotin carboxyl carrier protein
MKVHVRASGRTFEVELGDLGARPIVATIEGERFEVWPETPPAGLQNRTGAQPAAAPAGAADPNAVYAPLPGIIVSIAAQPGAAVDAGQELCALEAMKMKNVLRATRAGRIAEVRVSVGQFAKHREVLMRYEDESPARPGGLR